MVGRICDDCLHYASMAVNLVELFFESFLSMHGGEEKVEGDWERRLWSCTIAKGGIDKVEDKVAADMKMTWVSTTHVYKGLLKGWATFGPKKPGPRCKLCTSDRSKLLGYLNWPNHELEWEKSSRRLFNRSSKTMALEWSWKCLEDLSGFRSKIREYAH